MLTGHGGAALYDADPSEKCMKANEALFPRISSEESFGAGSEKVLLSKSILVLFSNRKI
jgi:hypothetical protein